MKAVFLGTPHSAIPSLEALSRAGHEVVLVVTQPDRPLGRSATPKPPPVKAAALDHGFPVFQPTRVRTPEFAERLASGQPDVLVVVAYGRILPPAVLQVAPLGAINVHFSLLPRYRGAAPVQWALARGETVTGVTTMRLNERMDEGDLFLQREVPVGPGEHAPALLERLARVGASVLAETLGGLAAGSLSARPQDHRLATYAPILTSADGDVDFTCSAHAIEGRVRGFDPWPGVWGRTGERRIRLVEADAVAGSGGQVPPGLVLRLEGDRLLIACGGGSLLAVRAVQPEGRRVITVREALNGRQLHLGEVLEGPQRST